MRNHPTVKALLLGWLCFFIGLIIFALADPFHWGDSVAYFGYGSFFLLIWLMIFFQFSVARKRNTGLTLRDVLPCSCSGSLRFPSSCFLSHNLKITPVKLISYKPSFHSPLSTVHLPWTVINLV